MFPAVETADQAAAAVASTRYPPRGVRGVMTTARMSGYAISPDALQSYYAFAERETCAIVQIESAAAVERIPEIAAIDGVDGIFVGPSYLAASMTASDSLHTPRWPRRFGAPLSSAKRRVSHMGASRATRPRAVALWTRERASWPLGPT